MKKYLYIALALLIGSVGLMGMTHFPSGVSSFGVPIMGPGIPTTTGQYVFVSSAVGSDDNDGLKATPYATFAKALDKCTADQMDVIILMPGHSEDIAGAAGIAADVAGVTTVGIGQGSLRPKFTFSNAASTFTITAEDQTFINIEWEAAVADVVMGLDISGVDDLTFDGCWFTEATTALNFVIVMDLATGADNITINRCRFIGADASNDHFIRAINTDGFYVYDSLFYMNVAQTAAVGLIEATGATGVLTNVEIKNTNFRSLVDGANFIDLSSASNSGVISNCMFSSLDTGGAVTGFGDVSGIHVFECFVAGDADSFGLVGGGTLYTN